MDLKQFGEQLRSLRKEAQWSQEQLIEALDQVAYTGLPTEYRVIDSTLLSRWEHARTQNGRQWKPTRSYTLYLIRLFAPYLDLARAQQWAAQAGYQISSAELQTWFELLVAAQQESAKLTQANAGNADDFSAFPHNLPTLLTTFVGREAETARLIDYLANPTTRLVTLVGEGGVGKTRLALQVAHTIANERIGPFGDGVYLISLVGVSTVNAVVSALADELGLMLANSDAPEQQLLLHLRERRLLLVLDNFEHLVASVSPLVTTLLHAAPDIHLLVTSRTRLNLAEEWIVALAGLPFPATAAPGYNDGDSSVSSAVGLTEDYGSVRLFMARARQIDAQFGLETDPMQSEAVARICGLLQGIPLGIEMATAWVHMLSCVEISNQIARNLDFLTSPHRNVPGRHRSMRAVFEHSWRLLTEQEQDGLAALAVFRGSFTHDAATHVAGASLLTLRSLVDKSLLTYTAGRYELHELLRQFAEEQLNLAGDKQVVTAARHSTYYLHFVAARELRLAGHEAHQAADEITTEFNNIRQAWTWAATHLRLDELDSSLYALWRFYLLNGASSEGEQLFRLASDQINAAGTTLTQTLRSRSLLSKLLTMRAMFLKRQEYF
jgi:predicted ATPase/transcriptional regulator with XRE-family HTH domain